MNLETSVLKDLKNMYANKLYINHNKGAIDSTKNLSSVDNYNNILNSVVDLVIEHPDWALENYIAYLRDKSGLENLIKLFIYDRKLATGAVLRYATKYNRGTYVVGNRREVVLRDGKLKYDYEKMTNDTLFDLASATKIFTSVSLFLLLEDGTLSFNDKVTNYAPQFKNLENFTVGDLLSFDFSLITNKRIDQASNMEEAKTILFDLKENKDFDYKKNPYSDMQAMVLKYVIEGVIKKNNIYEDIKSYKEFVEKRILKPLNMSNTYADVPEYLSNLTVDTGGEYKIFTNQIKRTEISKREVNDPKARIINDGTLSGHAGIFSTIDDMSKFSQIFSNNCILQNPNELLNNKYRTKTSGREYLGPPGIWRVHPVPASSEITHLASGMTFASPGATGIHIAIDPLNELYTSILSNKRHNRITYISPDKEEKIIRYNNGLETYNIDGSDVPIISGYDTIKDELHKLMYTLTIQISFLEKIYKQIGKEKEVIDTPEFNKTL